MPIMSFSISDELRKVIKGLVERKKMFKNQSGVVRTALNHFLSSSEAQFEIDESIDASEYKISGQVMLTFRKDEKENSIMKEIFKVESKYPDSIMNFQYMSLDHFHVTCIYNFSGSIFDFRSFVDELDSISDITQVRYIINS